MSHQKKDALWLIARIIIGLIFITAGWMKISNMAQTVGYFGTMGIPAFLAYIVGYGEFIGGILLAVGYKTCMAAGFLTIIMIVAIFYSFHGGFQSYSLPLATLAGLLAILSVGSGKHALRRD